MQVKEISQEGLKHSLEIMVPAKDIDKQVEARLKEVGKDVRLPGFRPGKAPVALLKQRYGRTIMGEVLEKLVNDNTAKAMVDRKLRPAVQPKIEVKEFDEGKDLVYSVVVEVLPEIKVMEMKGLKLEKPVAKVEKKAVDEALERITAQNQPTQKVEENRASKTGDILVIDFHGRTKDDGVEHPGMHAHGSRLKLGSGQFIGGFEEQLTGKKAGDKVEVNVTFPEGYGAAELAGRDAVFDVDIQEIHEPATGGIDDAFAQKLGFDDVAGLRGAVEEQIKKEYDSYSRLKLKRQLLDVMDEKHQFEIPPAMLDAEYDLILRQIEQERQMNPKYEEKGVSDEEKEELRMIAERRVRLGLVLSEFGSANKVTITDQELQRAVIAEAQKFPGQEKMVFEFYKKNPQAIESLRAPIYEDKVVEMIFAQADITEKEISVDELTADDEDDELPSQSAKKAGGKKAAAKKAKK